MPKATDDHTTADPAPVTADAPAPQPAQPYCGTTIAALGRRLHAVNDIHDGMDEAAGRAAFPKVLCRRAIQERAEAERSALSDLILTLPADTLADAAVQLDIACGRAEGLADDDRLDGTLAKFAAQIYRAIVSAGMVVCRSAGLDPTTVAWNDLAATHARVFAKAGASAKEPDAELLRLCAAFDELERQYQASFPGNEKEIDEARAEIVARQTPLVDRICGWHCDTLAGFRAKAGSLALWDEYSIGDMDEGCWNERLLHSLMHDLTGRTT